MPFREGMGKTKDLRAFEWGMVVGARRNGLTVSRTAMLLVFSHSSVSRVYQECPPPKGHPDNLKQLWEALESIWPSIPVERFRHARRAKRSATQYYQELRICFESCFKDIPYSQSEGAVIPLIRKLLKLSDKLSLFVHLTF